MHKYNGVLKELKFQRALQRKSDLPVLDLHCKQATFSAFVIDNKELKLLSVTMSYIGYPEWRPEQLKTELFIWKVS